MTRRTFLESTALAAAIASTACQPTETRKAGGNAPASFEFDEVTAGALQDAMQSGKQTARAIADRYLARIAEIDRNYPGINSVIEINPEAASVADALDRERAQKGARGPLHGIPVLIKDNIDTADRMNTTAGSLALAGSIAAQDSFVAHRLRSAGAVILGKTNLSEWANFRSSHSVSGWSGRGGLTRNPYALDRNPCGSSSGSGAAVAANLCALAIGTETDGSVVCPASINGIVGIKPTLGLVSRAGIIPIAHSQDTAGPMARTVRDAAILLGVLAGQDPRDAATKAGTAHAQADYTKFLDAAGLRRARIGVARKFFGFNAAVDRVMENCLAEMKRQGAEIIDPADLPSHGKFGDAESEVLHYEFKADLNAYLSALGAATPVHSLADVIAFNEKHRGQEMPYFDQETMVKSEMKGPLTEKAYLEALAKCQRLSRLEGIDAVIAQHRLDAIVAPTAGPAWLTDLVNGDHDSGGCSTPAAVAGYPHITVPAGFIQGLPIGISFFGPAWSEPVLLKLAYSFEQAVKAREAPRFLVTVDVRAS
jgi:amidase